MREGSLSKLLDPHVPVTALHSIIYEYSRPVARLKIDMEEPEDPYASCLACPKGFHFEGYLPKEISPQRIARKILTWYYSIVLDDDPTTRYPILEFDICSEKSCSKKARRAAKLQKSYQLTLDEWKKLQLSSKRAGLDGIALRNFGCKECYNSRTYTVVEYFVQRGIRTYEYARGFRFCKEHSKALLERCNPSEEN